MSFRNGSQNDDFVFNGIKFPNSFKEKIVHAITDTVKPLQWTPAVPEKCVRCKRDPPCRVFEFFKEKFIIRKSFRIFYINCDNFIS